MKKDKMSIELIIQASLIIGIMVYQFLVIVFTFDGRTSGTMNDKKMSPEIFYQREIATSNLNNSIQELNAEENSELSLTEQKEMFAFRDSINFAQLHETYHESFLMYEINQRKNQFQNSSQIHQ